jgi:predicted aldo/keto reductase-like oxidoreductase
MTSSPVPSEMPRTASLWPGTPRVCRLGLATRGNTHLAEEDVRHALARGIGYLNWCGHPDGMSAAVRDLSARERESIVVAAQLGARTAEAMRAELADALASLGHAYLDVVTLYYVETPEEWDEIAGPGGALAALHEAKAAGQVRAIGLTSHQRPLAARIAASGALDMLMVRYNAAHRGAEREVFPTTDRLGLPVITFTAQRWGALPRATPADPAGFVPPPPREWYRFALASPSIHVVLMAPDSRTELDENLSLLDDWRPSDAADHAAMKEHGDRVRATSAQFW